MIGTNVFGLTRFAGQIPNIGAPALCNSWRLSENDMTGVYHVNYLWKTIQISFVI
jgi:hypothetical protein